jgi:hypothetical protein
MDADSWALERAYQAVAKRGGLPALSVDQIMQLVSADVSPKDFEERVAFWNAEKMRLVPGTSGLDLENAYRRAAGLPPILDL